MDPMMKANISETVGRALALHQGGRLAEAEALYRKVLSVEPRQFECLHFLGLIEAQRENFKEADRLMSRSLRINGQVADAFANHARVLNALKRSKDAMTACEKALAMNPRSVSALVSRGIALFDLGRIKEALASYDQALAFQAGNLAAITNRANALVSLKRYDEALASYDKVLAINIFNVEAWVGRANLLQERGQHQEALAAHDRALAIKPDYVPALTHRGNVLMALRRLDEAIASYDRALASKPDEPLALASRGYVLLVAGRFDDALAACDQALAIDPKHAYANFHRGNALAKLGRLGEAIAAYERAISALPKHGQMYSVALMACLNACDWDRALKLSNRLRALSVEAAPPIQPFVFLACSADPAEQYDCAKYYAAASLSAIPASPCPTKRHGKIRLAYVSGDFHPHPVTYSIARLIEIHDRSRFEVIGISFGANDGSDIRLRLERAFDTFHDVASESDQRAADLMRDLEIDIAVDLTGYTNAMRTEIFARRPAPIQVSHMGFLGTMGTDRIDYVIADAIALPAGQQQYYTEMIVHLPECFLVTDDQQPIAPAVPSRAEVGLPEDGFVFCSFNNSYKIQSEVFDAYLRILRATDGSVLWLYKPNGEMAENLRAAAKQGGVDPARLVFADNKELPDHLARQQLADLFLDTTPYNAGATASAALWVGVPVLTTLGTTFIGRMAASMLHAIGLPELVADNLAHYEALAIELARSPTRLQALKDKLAANRLSYPLFNTDRFRGHIEAAYQTMWDLWQRGEKPRGFGVPPSISLDRGC
jgi:protein O-GlcNAc transferase